MTNINVRVNSKRYPDSNGSALENIEFSVNKGEIIGIVGPSGAGKSTLLNIIGGLDVHFQGELSFGVHPADNNPSIGYMFQSPRLMPWLTVTDNVLLVVKNTNSTDVQPLLDSVGLGDRGHLFPLQLSGGMQRRVALARAFVNHPSILLLDEPFVSLDKPTADRLRTQLLELWSNERPAVLYVTHDLREALSIADRIVFLSAGPGTVILDEKISLARPRTMEDPGISEIYNRLIRRYPDLLAGRI